MTEPISPIGTPVAEDIRRRLAQDAAFRARWEAGAEFREIAWLLIKYRMDFGLSQEQLAQRVGTSATHISRIESGRHKTSLSTLLRIARALDLKLVIGFERPSGAGQPERHTVAL